MIEIRVHRFSVPLIRAYHSGTAVRVSRSSIIYHLLITTPSLVANASLDARIHLTGPSDLLSAVHADAGHTLYRAHLEQLMIWMHGHSLKGANAYTAMVDFYELYGITEDDMPYATAYKSWQRWILKKNAKKPLSFSPTNVLPFTKKIGKSREDILRHLAVSFQPYALEALHHHPLPSDRAITRHFMRTLFNAGMTQETIGEIFGCTQQAVSYHMSRH